MSSLFEGEATAPAREPLDEGAVLLRGFANDTARVLVEAVERVAKTAPFRYLETRGGYTMSVAMTNCGRVGWVSDRNGYR
jgi:alkylated DNA repair protein (DNA oxidative demethylase)